MLSIREFYKDKTIFITGGSGFMGKVLIEKLLYSCSDLKQIFILMRPKRGKSGAERLEDFAKIPLFERISREKPEVLKKLLPVYGDVINSNLGLSNDELSLVLRETNIIFHFAATLNFEAPLKTAVEMNMRGVDIVMDLAKQMSELKVMVHFSTAFCCPDQKVLREQIYQWDVKPRDLMKTLEWLDEKIVSKIQKKLIKGHPNTYTYTKRLAEILVRDEHDKIPVCIIRPSIVTSSYREPIPGWVDNMNGPVGLFSAAAKGLVRASLGDDSKHAEIMPVDLATNGIIVYACKVGTLKEKPKQIPILNLTVKPTHRWSWNFIIKTFTSKIHEYPMDAGIWYPHAYMTKHKWLYYTHIFFSQWIPALLLDGLLTVLRRDRVFVKLQKKIYNGTKMLEYFTLNQWDFRNEQTLGDEMSAEENVIFPTDELNFDISEYAKSCMIGARQYILKESLSNLPRARIHLKFMRALDFFVNILRIFLLGWFVKVLVSKFVEV